MRRSVTLVTAAAVVAATVATAHAAQRPARVPGAAALRGIPSGAPPAAYAAEPTLPAPRGWPFGEAFPRTSGTGRLAGGALLWTDFVYDDHGATGVRVRQGVADLAPSSGTYVYSDPRAHNNGADIFRAAVGLDRAASYWRVDWTTLADRRVPIAEWTLDTDSNTATGTATWPAGAGVSSSGIDRALVVSSRGAQLLDAATGRVLASLRTTVDMRAQSFVVRVPRSVLAVSGTWKVRLAAGLADATGRRFAPVSARDGALPGQTAVYNVAFRSFRQEPPVYKPSGDQGELMGNGLARDARYGNFWMEGHQADALTQGDVSAFALDLTWADLAGRRSTAEPTPTGYTNRWYVSPLHLGQGVVYDSGSAAGDLRPNFLGRIQPYAVYVPTSYDARHPTPLTWILHSLGVQHNQYGALDPSMIQQECEDRHSICATTLGYGPDGWYLDEAEVDFWRVWHALATAYTLDPERTVISGYSMGGYASYKLGLEYPDLFARAMPLAGPPGCGLRVAQGVGGAAAPGRCTTDGDTTPLVGNARWLPYVMADGAADELVPVTSVLQQVHAFDAAGERYHFELYPAEDHMVYATQDGFSTAIAALGGTPRRVRNPGTVAFSWYPHLARPEFGIGPTGAYWVRGLRARSSAPGTLARVVAVSGMLPMPPYTVERQPGASAPGDPTPAVVVDNRWVPTGAPAPRPQPRMTLTLRDVAALAVDCSRARLQRGTVSVTTDGTTLLRLTGLRPGTRALSGGRTVAVAGRDGVLTLPLTTGRHVFVLR